MDKEMLEEIHDLCQGYAKHYNQADKVHTNIWNHINNDIYYAQHKFVAFDLTNATFRKCELMADEEGNFHKIEEEKKLIEKLTNKLKSLEKDFVPWISEQHLKYEKPLFEAGKFMIDIEEHKKEMEDTEKEYVDYLITFYLLKEKGKQPLQRENPLTQDEMVQAKHSRAYLAKYAGQFAQEMKTKKIKLSKASRQMYNNSIHTVDSLRSFYEWDFIYKGKKWELEKIHKEDWKNEGWNRGTELLIQEVETEFGTIEFENWEDVTDKNSFKKKALEMLTHLDLAGSLFFDMGDRKGDEREKWESERDRIELAYEKFNSLYTQILAELGEIDERHLKVDDRISEEELFDLIDSEISEGRLELDESDETDIHISWHYDPDNDYDNSDDEECDCECECDAEDEEDCICDCDCEDYGYDGAARFESMRDAWREAWSIIEGYAEAHGYEMDGGCFESAYITVRKKEL